MQLTLSARAGRDRVEASKAETAAGAPHAKPQGEGARRIEDSRPSPAAPSDAERKHRGVPRSRLDNRSASPGEFVSPAQAKPGGTMRPGQVEHRVLRLDLNRADPRERTVPASLSSELPVERFWGV